MSTRKQRERLAAKRAAYEESIANAQVKKRKASPKKKPTPKKKKEATE